MLLCVITWFYNVTTVKSSRADSRVEGVKGLQRFRDCSFSETLEKFHTLAQLSAREGLIEFCRRGSCKTDTTSLQWVSPGAQPRLFWMQAELAHTTYLMNRDSRSCAWVLAVYFRCHGYPGSLLLQLVSECVDVFVSQICRPKGGRCCTNQVASEMRSNWNAVVSELRNSKCHGACSVQNLLSLHLPPPPPKRKTRRLKYVSEHYNYCTSCFVWMRIGYWPSGRCVYEREFIVFLNVTPCWLVDTPTI